MKNALQHLLVFSVLALVFSALTGCSGTATNNANGTNTAGTNKNAQSAPANASDFQTFQASLAAGETELLDETKTKISDRKGKVLLVNLWATWCGPCRGEMPHLVAMQNQYADKGFEVLGLDVGFADSDEPEPTSMIKSFAEKMQLNY